METNPERATAHWYILCYIENQKRAYQRLSGIENLQFYAPVFFPEHHKANMQEAKVFRNYAFIYASQDYIYQQKKLVLGGFNFIQNIGSDSILHPYVTDYEIEQLRKVEKMNNGMIPLTLTTDDVFVGDTVEILTGDFKGFTATALTKNGSKYRQTYLCINGHLTIPLGKLTKEQFRIISYATQTKQNSELNLTADDTDFIINALKRHYALLPSDETTKQSDRHGMRSLTEKCKCIVTTSANTRLRIYTLMAVADIVSDNEDACYRNLNLAQSLMQKSITKGTRLFHSLFRYLCTLYPDHYLDFKEQSKDSATSLPRSMQSLTDLANLLHKQETLKLSKKSLPTLFTGFPEQEYWFCLTAPKKKTDAVKLFRDNNIQTYSPVLTDNNTTTSKKNILKDLFFVKTTYNALTALRAEHPLFKILTQNTPHFKQVLTYPDSVVDAFDYVNSLDIPGKEILRLTTEQESLVSKSQRKTYTLGDRTIEGRIMSSHIGNRTQEKMLFLLPCVAAISLRLD